MVEADWGEHEDTFGSLTWDVVLSDEIEDVPAVHAAVAAGYFPVSDAPMWSFLPAIWPAAHRVWVRDTRVRSMIKLSHHGPGERLWWSAADHAEIERDINGLLVMLGVPPRPAGRLWLLRPPPQYPTLEDVLRDVWDGWQAITDEDVTAAFVRYAHTRICELF